MQITKMDVKEVADAISSRFERDIVRLVTMGLSFDEDFGDCIRIVVYLDEDTTMDDIKCQTAGFTAQVMGLLRDELKDLWPFVGFKKYSSDSAPDPLSDPRFESQIADSVQISDDVPEALPAHGAEAALRERPPKITKQNMTEVVDSIRSWCDRGIVRRVTMKPSTDEEFGDCVRIVAYLDSDTAEENGTGGVDGAPSDVLGILKTKLGGQRPAVQFDDGNGSAVAIPHAGADPAG